MGSFWQGAGYDWLIQNFGLNIAGVIVVIGSLAYFLDFLPTNKRKPNSETPTSKRTEK
jgi:hypothetical protein